MTTPQYGDETVVMPPVGGVGDGQYIPPDEAARYQRFKVAEAARAGWDEAMRGNGSDSAFVRWLTRKPLPIKMSASRVICGLLWAFWTIVCLIYMVDGGGAGAAFTGFIFAVLCGFYDFRIWTRRATRLAFFIVF